MKDEFTTKMHAELLGWSQSYAQIKKGLDKADVCEKHGFSVKYYEDNIEAAKKRCF